MARIRNVTYLKLEEPRPRRTIRSLWVRVDLVQAIHTLHLEKPTLQVILPDGGYHTWSDCLPVDRETKQVGHVL